MTRQKTDRFDYTNDSEYERLSDHLHDARTQKIGLETDNKNLRSQLTSTITIHQQKKIDMRVNRATASDVAEAQEAINEATIQLETNVGQQQILHEKIDELEKQLEVVTTQNILRSKAEQLKEVLASIVKQRTALIEASATVQGGYLLMKEIQSLPQESRLQVEQYMLAPAALRDFFDTDKILGIVREFSNSIRVLEEKKAKQKNLRKVS